MTARIAGPPERRPTDADRSELVDMLRGRWHRPITVLVAGAGFGKTTVLGQAWEDNRNEPRGLEFWLAVTEELESGTLLAGALADTLGLGSGIEVTASSLARAVANHAPLDVCVVLDDLHHLGSASGAVRFLDELIELLPANGHLVLSSRQEPPVRLTRMLARNEVLQLTQQELGFADREIASVARRSQMSDEALSQLGRWPALVDLASRGVSPSESALLAEVGERLTGDQRRVIGLLLETGPIPDSVIAAGLGLAVSARELLSGVPMIDQFDRELLQAHELWRDAVGPESVTEGELLRVISLVRSTAVMDQILRRAREREAPAVQAAVVAHTLGSMAEAAEEDLLERWLGLLLPGLVGEPTEHLLRGSALLASLDDLDEAGRLLSLARRDFEAMADDAAEVAALGRLILHGRLANDTALLGAVFDRVMALHGKGWSALGVVVAMANAALHEAVGDFDAAMEELIDVGAALDQATRGLVVQYRSWLAMLAGRGRECIDEARANAAAEDVRQREANSYLLLLDFFSGTPPQPEAMVRGEGRMRVARHQFVYNTNVSMMEASVGSDAISDHDEILEGATASQADQYLIAVVDAARELHHGDEVAAAAVLGAAADELGDPEPLALGHLLRFAAYPYLLVPGLRPHLSDDRFGPEHQQRLAVARSLEAARRGDRDAWAHAPSPGWYVTSLPLLWSTEAALLARRDGEAVLADGLVARLDRFAREPFRRRLAEVAESDDPAMAGLAAALLDALPRLPAAPVELRLLGPPRVRRGADGTNGETEEIRRTRVAQLLALLAIDPTQRRDVLIDALWPEKARSAGQSNLRMTLSHLRATLEPGRPRRAPSAFLRDHGDSITLLDLPELDLDVWRLTQAATEARQADAAGDIAALGRSAEEVLQRWAEPDSALWSVGPLPEAADRLRSHARWAATRTGELALIAGNHSLAIARAEQAIDLDPADQRAHRLLIATRRSSGDAEGADAAVAACRAAIPEGELEDPTRMVMQAVDDVRPAR